MIGRGQNVVPPPESDKHFVEYATKLSAMAACSFTKSRGMPSTIARLDSQFALASHHRGIGEHVLVMGGVYNTQVP